MCVWVCTICVCECILLVSVCVICMYLSVHDLCVYMICVCMICVWEHDLCVCLSVQDLCVVISIAYMCVICVCECAYFVCMYMICVWVYYFRVSVCVFHMVWWMPGVCIQCVHEVRGNSKCLLLIPPLFASYTDINSPNLLLIIRRRYNFKGIYF